MSINELNTYKSICLHFADQEQLNKISDKINELIRTVNDLTTAKEQMISISKVMELCKEYSDLCDDNECDECKYGTNPETDKIDGKCLHRFMKDKLGI